MGQFTVTMDEKTYLELRELDGGIARHLREAVRLYLRLTPFAEISKKPLSSHHDDAIDNYIDTYWGVYLERKERLSKLSS